MVTHIMLIVFSASTLFIFCGNGPAAPPSVGVDSAPWESPFELAMFAALALHDDLVDIRELMELGESLANSGDEKRATEVYILALERIHALEPIFQHVSDVLTISAGLRKAGNTAAADAVLKEAVDSADAHDFPDIRKRELLEVVVPLDRVGQKDKSRHILDDIFESAKVDDKNDRYLLEKIAEAYAQTGQREPAVQIAKTFDDHDERMYLLQDIARGLGDAGLDDEGLTVAESIEDALTRASALNDVSTSLANAGKWSEARDVADSIALSDYRAHALNEVAAAHANAGNRDAALELLSELIDEGKPSRFAHFYGNTVMDMIKTLAQLGETEQATALLEFMDESELKAIAAKAIARAYAQSGRAGDSLELLPKIKHDPHRLNAVYAIAIDLGFAGEREQARSLLEQRVKFAERIRRPGSKALALSMAAESFADIGDFGRAIELARSIRDAKYKTYALQDIAETLASEAISENREEKLGTPIKRRIKTEFTPEEQQLARQLVEAMQPN